jgi:LPS sulfotransferase NodH
MIAHRIFWTREEDEVWKGVFAAEGWDEMTKAYQYLAEKHPAPKKLFLSMFQDLR